MIQITDKQKCCGCEACFNICPTKAISMVRDNEGYLYPVVDLNKCIDCGLCESVCPFIQKAKKTYSIKIYAAIAKDKGHLMSSSSGGMFGLLANRIIEEGGVVFGAKLDEKNEVRHDKANTLDGIEKFKKSKYVQSRINNVFKEVREELNLGKKVLFSGTPCQIHGLNLFLKKEYPNLLLVDIFCAGVPSPMILADYVKFLEKKYKSTITSLDFRSKEKDGQKLKITFANGKILIENSYLTFCDETFRPSCYRCPSNNFRSGSDITIGDFWGASTVLDSSLKQKTTGVSAVIIKTEKGLNVFNNIRDHLSYLKETDLETVLEKNPRVVQPSPVLPGRKNFFKHYKSRKIMSFLKPNILKRAKRKIDKLMQTL